MSTPVRRRRVVLPACLGAALALAATGVGCGKQTQPVTAPDAGGGGTAVAPAPELAPIEHPSQMMPRDTSVLVVGSSITRAAEVFERDRLVQAFGPQYTAIRSIMTGTLGYDLLDPAQWREVGLDPDGPAGLAVSDLVTGRVVLFATVANRTKVVELVRRVAGKAQVEIVEQSYGPNASVLRAKGEGGGAVVLRDQWVVLVLDDANQKVDLAERLVTADPNVSLAAQVGYRKATGGMRAADLTVYFDVVGMVAQANMEAEEHQSKPDTSWAEEELARAKKQEAPPEQIADLERQVQEQRQWQEEWERRQEGERALAELLASGVEGVGFSTTVKRSGPVFDGRVVAGPDAFLRRLMINREGSPVLPTAMNGAPLWCGSGRMDPGAAFELLEAIAGSEGKDYAELLADAKAKVGLDLKADLQPVFEGHAEVCVAADGSLEELMAEPQKSLGLGAIVQLSNEAKAKYLLAKMATSGSKLGKRMRKQGEGYVVDVPDWRAVHLQPVGSRIVVSTDPELGKRIASGDPGSMPSKIRPPGARGALNLGGTAATQGFDLSSGFLFLMAGRGDVGEPMVLAPGLTAEEMEKVPLSGASKKARKALDKARADVDRLERKREDAQLEQMLAVTDGLGMLIGALTEDDRGFVLSGGQFLRAPSMGAVIEMIVSANLGEARPGLDPAEAKALDDAWQRHMEASEAYSKARLADAEKWKKKHGR